MSASSNGASDHELCNHALFSMGVDLKQSNLPQARILLVSYSYQ
jgi:hypothetical protein